MIGKYWKILKPEQAFGVLSQNFNNDGYWPEYKVVCDKLKLSHDNLVENCPESFVYEENISKEEYFAAFVFLNILSFIAAFDETWKNETNRLAVKTLEFLKKGKISNHNNINSDDEIILKNYLVHVKEVIENWTNIMK